jgi:hypothetical protein
MRTTFEIESFIVAVVVVAVFTQAKVAESCDCCYLSEYEVVRTRGGGAIGVSSTQRNHKFVKVEHDDNGFSRGKWFYLPTSP